MENIAMKCLPSESTGDLSSQELDLAAVWGWSWTGWESQEAEMP